MLHITNKNFESDVVKSELPVLIDFSAPWCAPCHMMSPVFEELEKEFQGNLVFGKINTDDDPGLAQRFQITGIPCLVLTKDGKEQSRIVGFMGKEALKERIESMIK